MSTKMRIRDVSVACDDPNVGKQKYFDFLNKLSNEIEDVIAGYDSIWKARAQYMGFSFGPCEIYRCSVRVPEMRMDFVMGMDVHCVCGKSERFHKAVSFTMAAVHNTPRMLGMLFDPWHAMANSTKGEDNPFAYEHLIKDGYTHEEATRIVQRGKEFDLLQGWNI